MIKGLEELDEMIEEKECELFQLAKKKKILIELDEMIKLAGLDKKVAKGLNLELKNAIGTMKFFNTSDGEVLGDLVYENLNSVKFLYNSKMTNDEIEKEMGETPDNGINKLCYGVEIQATFVKYEKAK
jgi:hypothetical protein